MSNLLKIIKIEEIMKPMRPIGAWYLRVSPRMITCKEFNAFIFDYTEGLLNDKQLKLFERHMKVCPMCRNFLKTYIAGYSAGKASFPFSDVDVPNTVPQELIDAIASTSNSSNSEPE